jgi:thymidylate synthase (FAD)
MEARLIDKMGDDNRVVDAARVSFAKLAENYTEEQNERLLKYLASHGHFTPFTHPQITIHEKVPIFVARQRFKHMVGFTYNEVSRRYVDDEPEFFIPDVWRGKPVNAKQGSSDEVIDYLKSEGIKQFVHDQYLHFLGYAESLYDDMIKAGIAPEQARMVLPQSMYTEYYVTGSLAAWARAYKLRTDPHAQKEIQDLAVQWNTIIRPLFPKSWEALIG